MKKIILILILILIMAFSFVGCSKNVNLNLEEINKNLSDTDLFSETEKIDISYLEEKYGLDSTGIEEYSIYMATETASASMYAIFKVTDSSVKENIESTFIDKYISSWTTIVYEPEEVKLVNNMYIEEYGNYLIYIISKDNDKAIGIIKN